jgi:hypothetical protein
MDKSSIWVGNGVADGQICHFFYSYPYLHLNWISVFLIYSSVFQVMVAALKFFLGSDRENEKNSDDSDSDVIILYMLY